MPWRPLIQNLLYGGASSSDRAASAQVAYFVNSGSEANDMAVLMARLYTSNYDVLALRNCYHGASEGSMGLTAHSTWKFNVPQVSQSTCNPTLSIQKMPVPKYTSYKQKLRSARSYDLSWSDICLPALVDLGSGGNIFLHVLGCPGCGIAAPALYQAEW